MSPKSPKRVEPFTRWQRLAIASALVSGVLVLGAAVLAYSGLYNVSARYDHFPVTTWILKFVRDRSVEAHSRGIEVPSDFNTNARAELGARHYRIGCAFCHGTPGEGRPPVADAMLPVPPDLGDAAQHYSTKGLHWIIRHGFKYTGMPAWPASNRPDEVWSLVAFVEQLNQKGPDTYAGLLSEGTGTQTWLQEDVTETCADCHGTPDQPTDNPYIPVLSGQSQAYLQRSLNEYKSARRESGFMTPIAHELTPAEIGRLSSAYAGGSLTAQSFAEEPSGDAERGAQIARQGLPDKAIPACLSCHGAQNSPQFPKLEGQPAPYIESQLDLWQRGGRDGTGYGAIMSTIAKRLDKQDIRDVASFFQTQLPDSTQKVTP